MKVKRDVFLIGNIRKHFLLLIPISLISFYSLAFNGINEEENFMPFNQEKNMLSVDNAVEIGHIILPNPLVVVTDLLGVEYYSKIEVFDDGLNVWALGYSEKLNPGVYIITSTSKQDLFKKTLVIRER